VYNRTALIMLKWVIVAGFLFVAAALAQSSSVSSAQIFVDVRPEAVLAWQGDSMVLVKIRLAPGTQARVWASDTCGAPTVGGQVIPASGALAIELASIGGARKPLVCLASSDGRLSASLTALH
jgi:hypothetical protein